MTQSLNQHILNFTCSTIFNTIRKGFHPKIVKWHYCDIPNHSVINKYNLLNNFFPIEISHFMSFLLNLYAQSRYKACTKTYQHCYKSYPHFKYIYLVENFIENLILRYVQKEKPCYSFSSIQLYMIVKIQNSFLISLPLHSLE